MKCTGSRWLPSKPYVIQLLLMSDGVTNNKAIKFDFDSSYIGYRRTKIEYITHMT